MKKLFCLVLIVCLLFAGCGKNDNTNEVNNNKIETNDNNDKVNQEELKVQILADNDLLNITSKDFKKIIDCNLIKEKTVSNEVVTMYTFEVFSSVSGNLVCESESDKIGAITLYTLSSADDEDEKVFEENVHLLMKSCNISDAEIKMYLEDAYETDIEEEYAKDYDGLKICFVKYSDYNLFQISVS